MAVKNKTAKHWIVLVVVSLMFSAFAGISNNTIGVFYSPVSEDLGILRGSFALHSTITLLVNGSVSLVVPNIIDRFGWKPSLIGGTILGVIGSAGMAFTESLFVFYILGGLRGAGGAFFGMVPMAMLLNNWFDEKNGLAISLASGLSGLVGMIFAPIFASIINTVDWETGFIAMGAALGIFALPAILYPYSIRPEDEGLEPYGYKGFEDDGETEDRLNTKALRNERRNKKFIMITLVSLIVFSVLHTNVLGINQHFSSYGESIGMSTVLSGYMLSAVLFGNIFFKLVIGPLSDRFGAIKATLFMNAMNVIGLILLITTRAEYPTIFAVFLFGSAFSVGSVALPLLSNQFFGRRLSGKYFPALTFASTLGSAISNTMVGYIFDFTGSYNSAFLIAIGFQSVNLLMIYLAYTYSIKAENEETGA